MDLESAARELKILAGKERLAPSELDRAKDLMVEIKRLGMSNPEIVELTAGRWSKSTVKGYTKGVRATDPEPWKSTTALFSEMLSTNLTLAQVRQAMATTTELEGMGTSLDDVVSLMEDIKRKETNVGQLREAIDINAQLEQMGTSPSEIASFIGELQQENIDTPSFVLLFHDWREAELTAALASAALNYKKQLEGAGFDIETLPRIAEAAGKLGSPSEVLEAVAKYANLGELDQELQTKRGELDAAGERLDSLRKETVAREKTLATYKRLEAMGFNEKALSALAKVADKYGGPRKVLTALNSFGDLSEIRAASEEMQSKEKQQRATLKNLEEKHSHLKSAIEMCQKLMQDHKFGLDAITCLLAMAKIYGEPLQVLKAVESYGKLEAMNEKIRQLKLEIVKIEARIEQLKKTQSQYEARNKANLDQFEALNVRAIEVGRTLGSIEEQLKQSTRAHDILNLLQTQ